MLLSSAIHLGDCLRWVVFVPLVFHKWSFSPGSWLCSVVCVWLLPASHCVMAAVWLCSNSETEIWSQLSSNCLFCFGSLAFLCGFRICLSVSVKEVFEIFIGITVTCSLLRRYSCIGKKKKLWLLKRAPVYVCFMCMYECLCWYLCTTHMPGFLGGQKRVPYSLELELQTVVNLLM